MFAKEPFLSRSWGKRWTQKWIHLLFHAIIYSSLDLMLFFTLVLCFFISYLTSCLINWISTGMMNCTLAWSETGNAYSLLARPVKVSIQNIWYWWKVVSRMLDYSFFQIIITCTFRNLHFLFLSSGWSYNNGGNRKDKSVKNKMIH